jgi:hypothetical protein
MRGMAQDTLPTYHFLLVAPNLGPEWLFDAARAYWDRFQPTIISDLTLIPLIPPTLSVAVTVLARHDRAPQYGVELAQQAPHALFDPIVYDFIEDAQAALDRRAQLNQPFGVPLIPTATWTPAPTAIPLAPTSGPVIPPRGSGFITQTPTPPAPDESAPPPAAPLSPTPGPITGG